MTEDGFQSPEDAFLHGQMDATSVQKKMAESGENPYITPEEAMESLGASEGDDIWQSYYKGYLSRWD